MIDTLLFDLDGTLLSMDQEEFIQLYFKGLYIKFHEQYDFEKLKNTIWEGTELMAKNNGEITNEALFWKHFEKEMQLKKEDVIASFEDFYQNDFIIAKQATQSNPKVIEFVHQCKAKGYTLVVATNPLFPQVATKNRLKWAGFEPSDFELITTYENASFCKPSLGYYQEILTALNKKTEQAIMVGNDAIEDLVAGELGMKTYLVTDCLQNKKQVPYTCTFQGNWNEVIEHLNKTL